MLSWRIAPLGRLIATRYICRYRFSFEIADEKLMSKTSPTVLRMVAVLNFFLEHPQQAYTLAQVVKSLRLNRATAHSILLGFVDVGYLYRRSDKSYILGAVLPSLAANAKPLVSPLAVANHEIRGLADDMDVIASALQIEDGEVVVRERAASVTHLGAVSRQGPGRYPIFPWGAVFLLGLPEAEVEARLDRFKPPLSAEVRKDVRTQLKFAKQYGFTVALYADGSVPAARREEKFHYVADLAPDQDYHVRYLIAPIFGAAGEVALAISVFGLPDIMKGRDVLSVGSRLLETCDRVTSFVRGRRPQESPATRNARARFILKLDQNAA